jgi:hypothetical protein
MGGSASGGAATVADGEASNREGANPALYAGDSEPADRVLRDCGGGGARRCSESGRGGGLSIAVVASN